MALWPFRRKSARRRPRGGAGLSESEASPLRSKVDANVTRAMSKKARKESTKLQRRQRTYSFSPGRHDSIRLDRDKRHVQSSARGEVDQQIEASKSTTWERTPTLHPVRRKSSKRRRDDHDREAEIKAMSAFMPTRSVTESHARSSSKQSTKRAKTAGFGRHQVPSSQVSLSYPDSVRSGMSVDSDSVAYKISVLDSLTPRPTLRYTPSARRPASRAAASAAIEMPKRSLGNTGPIHEDPSESRKRIDELADDLDAKDLRELMERDNRRRERKKQLEQDRTERKLSRRAERHRKENSRAKNSGTPPPENLERGVMGRELVGLGIEPASAVVTSSQRKEATVDTVDLIEAEDTSRLEPLEAFHRSETLPPDDEVASPSHIPDMATADAVEPEESVSALPAVPRSSGILHSKKSRSKSTLGSDKERLAEEDSGRKNSQESNKTASRMSFISWLKWGSKSKRNSGPSSFSNTSREEMQSGTNPHVAAQAEALARLQGEDLSNTRPKHASKALSAMPKRTKSRFREDLPEFPLSPPDSRVQSPEADPPPMPVLCETSPKMAVQRTPPSRHDTPPSLERSKGAQSTEPPLSMSLGSIDSEASWLSGRVGSLSASAKRDSVARSNRLEATQSLDLPPTSTQDDLAITEDEYLSRLAPDRSYRTAGVGRPSGEGRPSSDGGESIMNDNLRWGRVGAKAEVVQAHHHDREAMRSRQGLLNNDLEDEDDADFVTPSSSL
ncbi:hypothetical protein AAL_04633 [Moelleriella libera RCEF 2490]|uniref:Uncharacterized protein n=1 Tax=Moelleriella libera RCEF 2490 TaxID=1081109 RepID=A0A162IKA0_9HYPO|nr:hypothetical protein AAL_04633 [Moelleriella libera RCEF 2490]